jgi:hypothetical protein
MEVIGQLHVPAVLTPRERSTAGLGISEKKRNLLLLPELGHPIFQPDV